MTSGQDNFYNPEKQTYLGSVVDVGIAIDQQLGNVFVAVVSCDVKWSESGLGGDIRIVIVMQEQAWKDETKMFWMAWLTRGARGEQTGGLGVILLGCDVKSRESNFASGVIFQKHSHNLKKFNLEKLNKTWQCQSRL